jgi:glycosyltransferase involved in cell wall biosynthesis
MRPAQDQIKNIYGKCDVWLVGSRSEGFGLPILEAMACRTPVISTPTGAAPELTAPGGGVLVPMDDPSAMAKEIQRIVQLPDEQWRAMSDIAHQTATKYTWEDATTLFEAALERAIPIH